LQTVLFFCADYNIYVYIHCNFICGLSDVIIKTFSQSVSQLLRFLRQETRTSHKIYTWQNHSCNLTQCADEYQLSSSSSSS